MSTQRSGENRLNNLYRTSTRLLIHRYHTQPRLNVRITPLIPHGIPRAHTTVTAESGEESRAARAP